MVSESSSRPAVDDLVEFLRSLGTAEVGHTGHDFLTHLRAVHDLLAAHGADAAIARAGLFHSIYGTEGYRDFSLPLSDRGRIRALIGEQAEQLAYWNCVMDRASFDAAVAQATSDAAQVSFHDRDGSPPFDVEVDDLRDLAQLHLFDWLEQVERSAFGWDYRRAAYRQMAELVGGDAVALYNAVFAREPS